MKIKHLKMISYLYMILPIIIFVLGWCRPSISILTTLILLFILRTLLKQNQNDHEVYIKKEYVIIIFIFACMICILCGHGGMFYQSRDWDARNAIFRDLIQLDWPVYYAKSNSALTYYLAQWMVPAVVGKILQFICIDVAWMKANIVLLFWNAIGVTISILWIIKSLNLSKIRDIVIAMIIFIGFSGLDIIGTLLFKSFFCFSGLHLEWWASTYQYSSMLTQLGWVFNQSIVPWILTCMFLNEKTVENFMALILLCLPYAPLPFLGLVILFICKGIQYLIMSIQKKQLSVFIKQVFSLQNILSFLTILPIFYLFYYGNASATGENGNGGFGVITEFLTIHGLLKVCVFWFLEIGIYMIFLWNTHKKDPLFYTIGISLYIIPFFQLGYEYDFSMRVSIPMIVIINFWIVQLFIKYVQEHCFSKKLVALLIVLILGGITPFFELYRAGHEIISNGKINLVMDETKTFSNKEEVGTNFITKNPKETSFFYQYIARK